MDAFFRKLSNEEIEKIRDEKSKAVEFVLIKSLITNKFQISISEKSYFLKDDFVVVETERAGSLCKVLSDSKRVIINPEGFSKIIKKISPNDRDILFSEKLKEDAKKLSYERIKERGLVMKLVEVEIVREKNKIIFYFTADGRVDFRELVKDLAKILRSRIEMRQIGVRDEAKMIGGIGPCGLPLCCTNFLSKFESVSIKMAKNQGLLQNPQKISGLCGRLICCLGYENQIYEELRIGMPKIGSEVRTTMGNGVVSDINPLMRTVKVRFAEEEKYHNFHTDEVTIISGGSYQSPEEWEEISEEEKTKELMELEKE